MACLPSAETLTHTATPSWPRPGTAQQSQLCRLPPRFPPTCSVEMDLGPSPILPLQFLPAEGAGGLPHVHVSTCPLVLGTSGPSGPRSRTVASSQLHQEFPLRAPLLRPFLVRPSGSQRADFHHDPEGKLRTSPRVWGAAEPHRQWRLPLRTAVGASPLHSQRPASRHSPHVRFLLVKAPRVNHCVLPSPGRLPLSVTGVRVHSDLAQTVPPVRF